MSLVDLSKINLDGAGESKPLWSVVVGDYRYVLYTDNKVAVYKGESSVPAYHIDAISCSCPGDRYSKSMCKHRKAVQFLGDAVADEPVKADSSIASADDILDF